MFINFFNCELIKASKMNVVKNLLCRFGHLLLNVIQAIRRAICCRRRKEPEYILPLTITHVVDMEQSKWDVWPETENRVPLNNSNTVRSDKEPESSMFQQQQQQQQDEQEDFFKDMVPQIRKPKKLYIRNEVTDSDQARSSSNRLAMDPKAVLPGPDLGVIEDNPSNWESENLDEIWDPDVLLKESKMAEREKRLAEHQRRKQEKEKKRASRQESLNNMTVLSLSDSKDKPKYS